MYTIYSGTLDGEHYLFIQENGGAVAAKPLTFPLDIELEVIAEKVLFLTFDFERPLTEISDLNLELEIGEAG